MLTDSDLVLFLQQVIRVFNWEIPSQYKYLEWSTDNTLAIQPSIKVNNIFRPGLDRENILPSNLHLLISCFEELQKIDLEYARKYTAYLWTARIRGMTPRPRFLLGVPKAVLVLFFEIDHWSLS
jgi:hypothetical protein